MVGVFSLLPLSFARPLRRELERSDVIVPACQNEMGTSCFQCRTKWEYYGETFMEMGILWENLHGNSLTVYFPGQTQFRSLLIPVKIKPHVETSTTASNLNVASIISSSSS